MKDKVRDFIHAIDKANRAALIERETPDSGTCNLDSVVIRLPYWKEKDLEEVREATQVHISSKLSGIWSGYRFLGTRSTGQAHRNTIMVEAAYNSLKEDGYDVLMYYQID